MTTIVLQNKFNLSFLLLVIISGNKDKDQQSGKSLTSQGPLLSYTLTLTNLKNRRICMNLLNNTEMMENLSHILVTAPQS